jgi:hypothetical protein
MIIIVSPKNIIIGTSKIFQPVPRIPTDELTDVVTVVKKEVDIDVVLSVAVVTNVVKVDVV